MQILTISKNLHFLNNVILIFCHLTYNPDLQQDARIGLFLSLQRY